MSKGAIVSIVIAIAALSATVFAFLMNASPYVTIAEARGMVADNLHVAGDLDKESLKTDVRAGTVRFAMADETGERIEVLYKGHPPANLGEATKVVVVGGVRDGVFHAHDLLVKCPSKYEGQKA
jgi:cytochrome c-type biogenesis protein CcmE